MAEVAHVFVCPGHRLPMRELESADVNGAGFGGGHLGGRSKRHPYDRKTFHHGRRQQSQFRF